MHKTEGWSSSSLSNKSKVEGRKSFKLFRRSLLVAGSFFYLLFRECLFVSFYAIFEILILCSGGVFGNPERRTDASQWFQRQINHSYFCSRKVLSAKVFPSEALSTSFRSSLDHSLINSQTNKVFHHETDSIPAKFA